MPMQPSPIAETSRLLFPSLRFCASETIDRSVDDYAAAFQPGVNNPAHPVRNLPLSQLRASHSAIESRRRFQCGCSAISRWSASKSSTAGQRFLELIAEQTPPLLSAHACRKPAKKIERGTKFDGDPPNGAKQIRPLQLQGLSTFSWLFGPAPVSARGEKIQTRVSTGNRTSRRSQTHPRICVTIPERLTVLPPLLHTGGVFEIHVSSQREERLLVRRKIPGRRFRFTRRNWACSPISTEARCTEVKSGGLDLMRPPIGRSPPPALPSQSPSAVQPIRRFLLFSWL
jgi:hypothetical protein